MPLYELTGDDIRPVPRTSFAAAKLRERGDLQRLLRERVEIVAEGCLVIAEEFGAFEDSRRRIDLLAVDRDANLVVIELKRTDDGGHMDLQALRYAAMVSTMTFRQAAEALTRHRRTAAGPAGAEHAAAAGGPDPESAGLARAEADLLDHLGWDEPDEDAFAAEVRIVLAAADFSREITSTVLWLNDQGLDVRCVRLIPHERPRRADGWAAAGEGGCEGGCEGGVLLDVQQIIPLPEAASYQVRVREKALAERAARRASGAGQRDYTRYDLTLSGVLHEGLNKRDTAFMAVKHLCDTGLATPESICERVRFRRANLFRSAPGAFDDEAAFIDAVQREEAARGRAFDPARWYTGDGERIVHAGRSYAMTNQWGGRMIEWVDELLRLFPEAQGVVQIREHHPAPPESSSG